MIAAMDFVSLQCAAISIVCPASLRSRERNDCECLLGGAFHWRRAGVWCSCLFLEWLIGHQGWCWYLDSTPLASPEETAVVVLVTPPFRTTTHRSTKKKHSSPKAASITEFSLLPGNLSPLVRFPISPPTQPTAYFRCQVLQLVQLQPQLQLQLQPSRSGYSAGVWLCLVVLIYGQVDRIWLRLFIDFAVLDPSKPNQKSPNPLDHTLKTGTGLGLGLIRAPSSSFLRLMAIVS
jgi:hypothetical protein